MKGFQPIYGSLKERLIANTQMRVDGCWIWQGSVTKDGYAKFNYREGGKHKTARVHRVMFELLTGVKLPSSIELDHQCYIRCCIRPGPGHCMPATKAENLANRRSYKSACEPTTAVPHATDF